MTDVVERIITPMPLEEVAKIKAQVEQRWNEKPHYPGGGGMLSPGCMFRAEEILSMIAALEDARGKALEEAAKVAIVELSDCGDAVNTIDAVDIPTETQLWNRCFYSGGYRASSNIITAVRALVKP